MYIELLEKMLLPEGGREGDGKVIYIVLTRSTTLLSRLVVLLTGADYTHAAISFDRELSYMFSFGRRYANNPFIGCFHREDLREGAYAKAREIPGMVIELPVTEAQHASVAGTVRDFLLNNHRYGFNYIGLAKQTVGRAHYSERRFYCSEFVYHALTVAGILDLDIPRGRVRPQDFMWLGRGVYQGDLLKFDEFCENGAGGAKERKSNVVSLAALLARRNP